MYYYLKSAGEPPEFPSLEDLSPFLEAVHHACRAGEYDAANKICWRKFTKETEMF